MSLPIITVKIQSEHDTVAARQRARQIARLLGFDQQDQTRISTAVSEIARNAFNYAGGGTVDYSIEGRTAPQLFLIKVTDSGPGVAKLDSILDGTYESPTGMGLGLVGARRLMDQFQIESVPGKGTTIWLKKLFPKRGPALTQMDVGKLVAALSSESRQDPFQELQLQNQELLAALEEIRIRQEELAKLNQELEETNRGVVALYAELDEKADYLRRADDVKSRFLSNMSHEFRSPLSSILALSGLLLNGVDGKLNPEQEQQTGFIRKAAQDLLDLVNDLLDLAKVEAGKIEAKPTEFAAANLFGALRGMLRPLLLNQSVDLIFEDASHIPELYSDEGKVSQILRNFISNALKFTERGEVRVSATRGADDTVIFTVSDTGIGVEPQNLDLIFQDFSQVDGPIQRRVKGTGLGLPLSKKLATLLQGQVEVESQIGVGSRFSVRLPLRYVEVGHREAAPVTVTVSESNLPSVLIVEDSPEAVLAYKSYLRNSEFQPVVASTIRQAEKLLQREKPVAIVLDLLLRSEDTWAFLSRLQNDARTADIPILVASSIEDQAKAFHLGVSDYLVKPVQGSTFLARLRAITGGQRFAHVLMIDDNPADRYLIRQKLRNLRLRISETSSGQEGLLKAAELNPDIIILDLTMPGMSGFEVLTRLKETSATTDIPVLICTSRILEQRERDQLKGATAILSKDHEDQDPSSLAMAVQQVVNGTKLTGIGT